MRLVILLLLCIGSVARADNFNQGLTSYRRSDFSAAERAFLRVLQEGVNRATRAKVYKYVGLSQYMLGRKSDASNSFRSALRFDPMTELYPNEVLDSSVIEFFLQIKQDSKKKPATTMPRRPPVRKTPLAKKKPYVPKVPMTGNRRPVVRGKTATKQSPAKRVVTKRPPAKASATKQRKSTDSLFGTKKPKKITFGSKKTRQPTTGANRRGNLLLPSNKKLATSSGGGVTALHFMPFGIGQFVNDSRLAFPLLALQTGALGCGIWAFISYNNRQVERDGDAGYKEALDRKGTDQEVKCDSSVGGDCESDKQYLEKYKVYVDEPKYWLIGCGGSFALLWIGGTIEAIINRPLGEKYGALIPKLHYRLDDHTVTFAWRIPW